MRYALLPLLALVFTGAQAQAYRTIVVKKVYQTVSLVEGTRERALSPQDSLSPRDLLRLGPRSAIWLMHPGIEKTIHLDKEGLVSLDSVITKAGQPNTFPQQSAPDKAPGGVRGGGAAQNEGQKGIVGGGSKGGGSESANGLLLYPMYYPTDSERVVVKTGELRFEWFADKRREYRVIVTDDLDDMSNRVDTIITDTSLAISWNALNFKPERPLYWTVAPAGAPDSAAFIEFVPMERSPEVSDKSTGMMPTDPKTIVWSLVKEAKYLEQLGYYRLAEMKLSTLPRDVGSVHGAEATAIRKRIFERRCPDCF